MKTNCSSMKGKIWERGIWFKRGGCVFSHDGSCGVTLTAASVCLQLWINRLKARDLVLVEGDTHSCGAANIGAGSRWGERAENLRPASMCLWCRTGATRNCGRWFVYPPRETQTTAELVRRSSLFETRLWGCCTFHPQKCSLEPGVDDLASKYHKICLSQFWNDF